MSSDCNEIVANVADEVLHESIRRDDVAAVQQAIRSGANVNAIFRGGKTPLHVACNRGAKEEIVRILLDAGADPQWIPNWSPILPACYVGHLSIVEILINHDNSLLEFVDEDGNDSPLIAAIEGQNVDVVRFLINRGANVITTGPDERTSLVFACESDHDNVEIVNLLLAAGADVESCTYSSRTALHQAVECNKSEIMRALILQHNASMFAQTSKGETPFDVACSHSHRWSRAATIDSLLQLYAFKMTQDHGRLALHAILRAAEYSYAETGWFHPPMRPWRIILPLGKLTLNHFRTLLHSLETDVMIRAQDDHGTLPIHIACRTGAPVKVLTLLLELDPATLHIADHTSGALPLHDCCRQGNVVYSSVRYLVEQGGVGTLFARDCQGDLPLHVLCGSSRNPSLRTVQYMMQSFPATVATRNNAGQYPFMIAAGDKSTASLSVVYELVRANPDLLVYGE